MSPKEVKSWKPNEDIVLKKKRNKNFKMRMLSGK